MDHIKYLEDEMKWEEDMKEKKTVLLVVDVQKAIMENHPYNEKEVLSNIRRLINEARETGMEVIYVRHDGGVGDEFEYGTPGWELESTIIPRDGEMIFDKKYNSAFKATRLNEYLREKEIETILLVGMQTEYCIDTTCKVAFEYGYKVVIPESTTTTCDNELCYGEQMARYYEEKIWKGRFAKVLPMKIVLDEFFEVNSR